MCVCIYIKREREREREREAAFKTRISDENGRVYHTEACQKSKRVLY